MVPTMATPSRMTCATSTFIVDSPPLHADLASLVRTPPCIQPLHRSQVWGGGEEGDHKQNVTQPQNGKMGGTFYYYALGGHASVFLQQFGLKLQILLKKAVATAMTGNLVFLRALGILGA